MMSFKAQMRIVAILVLALLHHAVKYKHVESPLSRFLERIWEGKVDHGQFHISLTPHVLSAVPMIEPEDRMQGSMQGLGIGRDAYNTMENDGMAVDDRFSSAADTTPTPVSPSPRSRVQGSGDCLAQDHNELFEDPAAHDLVVSAYIARHRWSSGVSIAPVLQEMFVARMAMLFLVAAATCCVVIAKLCRWSIDWFDKMLEERIDKRTSKLTDQNAKQQRLIDALVAQTATNGTKAANELADKFSELRRDLAHELLEEARAERAEAISHYIDVGNDCLERLGSSMSWELMGARHAAAAGNAQVFCGLTGYIKDLSNRQADLERYVQGHFAESPEVAVEQLQRYEEGRPQQRAMP